MAVSRTWESLFLLVLVENDTAGLGGPMERALYLKNLASLREALGVVAMKISRNEHTGKPNNL